jgi:hypothetical protein
MIYCGFYYGRDCGFLRERRNKRREIRAATNKMMLIMVFVDLYY